MEASLQVFARLHQIFHVVDVGEVDLERLEELCLALGQLGVGEDAEQVAEVVAAVKGDPLHVIQQYNSLT